MEGGRLLRTMRIGILDQTFKSWSAGASFTRMMLTCLELVKDDRDTEVIFLSRSKENMPPNSFKSIFIGEQPDRAQWRERMKDAGLDVVIPVCDHTCSTSNCHSSAGFPISSICACPNYSILGNFAFEISYFRRSREKASVILLSSESVRMDFEEFFPAQAAKARVAHFPSLLWTLDRGDDQQLSGSITCQRSLRSLQTNSGGTRITGFFHRRSGSLSAAVWRSTS